MIVTKWLNNLSLKQIIWTIISILCLIIFMILTIVSNHKVNQLKDQMAYKRWNQEGGSAQVTVFMAKDTSVDDFMIKNFENALTTSLHEAAVEEKENARLFVDAYSAKGKVTLVSEQSTLDANAIGIGNDFFYFHPLELVSGRYFSGDELMKDFVVLDEEAAWQLFGSSNIEGMTVTIGGVPHTIVGVVKRDSSDLAKKAGLSKSVVYVSNETLTTYGSSQGIDCYEVTSSNPVKGMLATAVREKFGLSEDQMVVVENSTRFSVEALIPVILDFGTRSMQNTAVSFPYWENMARGTEDVVALFLLVRIICIAIPLCVLIVYLFGKWKHRKYKGKEFWTWIGGIYEKKSLSIRNHFKHAHSDDDGVWEEE